MRPGVREFRDASLKITIPKSVPEHMRAGMREISDLFVAPASRRQKLATILMNFVCQEADANKITLVLTVRAFAAEAHGGDDGMSDAELACWYQRFGFQPIQGLPEGMFMARQVREKPRIKPVTLAVAETLAIAKVLH